MSGLVVLAVLSDAKRHFGDPATWDRDRVAVWVRRRVREIVDGEAPAPAAEVPFPGFLREREPGEEG